MVKRLSIFIIKYKKSILNLRVRIKRSIRVDKAKHVCRYFIKSKASAFSDKKMAPSDDVDLFKM